VAFASIVRSVGGSTGRAPDAFWDIERRIVWSDTPLLVYRLSRDPSTSELGLALFGAAGEHELAVESSGPIAPEIVEEARARFGLLVIPVPHTSV
jgi:hypothetical protein